MNSFDISNPDELRELCSQLGKDFNMFHNLCHNNLHPREFFRISERTGIQLTDEVSDINSNIDNAFRRGDIIVVDKQYINHEVEIKNLDLFIKQFTTPLLSLLTSDVITSIKGIIQFVIENSLISSNNSDNSNDAYKIRFPFRHNNMITILVFKFKMLNVRRNTHFGLIRKYTYRAYISCISCVFSVHEDILILDNEIDMLNPISVK